MDAPTKDASAEVADLSAKTAALVCSDEKLADTKEKPTHYSAIGSGSGTRTVERGYASGAALHYVALPEGTSALAAKRRAQQEAAAAAKKKKEAEEEREREAEPESALMALPDELALHVMRFLDAKSLAQAGQVNFHWYMLAQDCNGLCELLIHKHIHVSLRMLAAFLDFVELMKKKSTALGVDHLGYLKDTLVLLQNYMKAKQEELARGVVLDVRPEFAHILAIFVNQLADVMSVVKKIAETDKKPSDNSDILELSLRRYRDQFQAMFPVPPPEPNATSNPRLAHISLLITDPQARALWDQHVGPDTYLCDFEEFFRNVVVPAYNSTSGLDDLRYCMAYFLNFPRDNTVTVYKWYLLTTLFGPWPVFFKNIKEYVLGRGFLGLINRLTAEELLKPGFMLIRFSRTVPHILAFSFHSNGKAHHQLNSATKSIGEFLKQLQTDHKLKLTAARVDGKSVYEAGSVTGYTEKEGPYICGV